MSFKFCLYSDIHGQTPQLDAVEAEVSKENPDKTYRELEQEKAEQATYENDGLVIDDTGECESCQ